MTNQLAIRCWLDGPLQSVVLDSRSHIYKYENAGIAYHSQAGCTPMAPLAGVGHLTADQIRARFVRGGDIHYASTRMICLENTLNGGLFPLDEISRISSMARQNGLIMHLDGARLWNASAETGVSIKTYSQHFESVSLCLSKGIGAPIGSVLAGPDSLIQRAMHFRKLFGGGWRQSGGLAEMAMSALDPTFSPGDDGQVLLKQDHDNAKWLADTLTRKFPGLTVENRVETNMLFLNVSDIVPKRKISV
eukprot:Partr_v1_DN28070_c1_g3_i4_m56814 putative Aldolase